MAAYRISSPDTMSIHDAQNTLAAMEELWTVTPLTDGMDSLWTDKDEGTNWICTQSDHPVLGQAKGLTTGSWITAQLDAAVTHTAHSSCHDEFFEYWEEEEKFILTKRSKRSPQSEDNVCNPKNIELREENAHGQIYRNRCPQCKLYYRCDWSN